eukprot:UN17373
MKTIFLLIFHFKNIFRQKYILGKIYILPNLDVRYL